MSLICKKAIMLAFYDERPNHIQHRKLGAWLVNCRRRYLLINNFEGSSVRDVDMGPVGHWGNRVSHQRPEFSTERRERANSEMIIRQLTI